MHSLFFIEETYVARCVYSFHYETNITGVMFYLWSSDSIVYRSRYKNLCLSSPPMQWLLLHRQSQVELVEVRLVHVIFISGCWPVVSQIPFDHMTISSYSLIFIAGSIAGIVIGSVVIGVVLLILVLLSLWFGIPHLKESRGKINSRRTSRVLCKC